MSSSWKSNSYNNTKSNTRTGRLQHTAIGISQNGRRRRIPPAACPSFRLSVHHSFTTHTDDACSLLSYCTVIYAPPKLKNCICRVVRGSCPCPFPCVPPRKPNKCNGATMQPILIPLLSYSLLVSRRNCTLFFRSIFCIIIARYIINGRGHVAQLKSATQNEKSSNHRTWRFCTVMSNLHSEKVGKVPHHQIEAIMGGIVCVCVCDLTMIILLRYSFHGLDGHTLSLFISLIGRHNVIVSS